MSRASVGERKAVLSVLVDNFHMSSFDSQEVGITSFTTCSLSEDLTLAKYLMNHWSVAT